MKNKSRQEALLLLADGTAIRGESIGRKGTKGGEICFNTGMTGYQEIYTDPSYYGQIIVNTTSHIGNYGVFSSEQESECPKINGLIVNSFSELFSRGVADGSLQDYLDNGNVVGIAEIDTRKLVRHIRSKGAMNAIISSEILDVDKLTKELNKVPDMSGLELSTDVSTKEQFTLGNPDAKYKVAVLDLGIKTSILKNLIDRDCFCRIFPAHTSYDEMKEWGAQGFFISNGPGDPAAMPYAVDTTRKIQNDDNSVFGICLGHQILALANDIPTYKMHHGHRGLNHPVKNLETGLCEITSQNHGFGVKRESVESSDKVTITHINLNDNTVEGLSVNGRRAFSVQYHPESSPGPHDSRYLFDKFVSSFE